MSDLFGASTPPSPADPSRRRGLQLFGLLGLLLAVFLLVRFVTPRLFAPTGEAATSTPPAALSESKPETEVAIGTDVVVGPWQIVSETTHDVKDAINAAGAPDQKDSVIFPGGRARARVRGC